MPALPRLDPADFDPVTGTLHWTRFAAILSEMQGQAAQAVLMIDLDDRSTMLESKENETEILPLLARAIRQAVRAEDLVAHLHDYRFAVLLPGAPIEMADAIASRIQESVDDTLFLTASGLFKLGVAIGGIVSAPSTAARADLIGIASANLVTAKSARQHVNIQ